MKKHSSDGFSYIDVMIALVITMFGILALLSALTFGVVQAQGQEDQMVAKHVASSTMESIMSLKETDPNRLGWIAVGNEGTNRDAAGVFRGVFVNGTQPVRIGTGPDNIFGTADDNGAVIPGMTREIIITDECDPDRPSPNCVPCTPTVTPNCAPPGVAPVRIRSLVVTVRYFAGRIPRQETLTTVLTDYARPSEE
ncbi:MAG: hypothetical protein ABL984_05875 [Pyrinomonadaceae bacterium]